MKTIFYEIGTYGPLLLILLSWYVLWNNSNMFFYYTIGVFLNAILNLIIKGLLQQPRPSEDVKEFNIALKHGKRFIFKDGIPYDIFGMPSGHTQSCLFSTIFVYYALKQTNLLYVYSVISIIVMIQRVSFNFHTSFQVVVGAVVGAFFANFVYYLSEQKIKGKITEKLDDNGPI